MPSPTEIYENFDALAARKTTGAAFGLELMAAVGAPRATITKLKDEASTGSFAWTRMLRFEMVPLGQADRRLDQMKSDAGSAPKARRPRLLVAYDGEGIAAHDTKIGDDLHVGIDVLSMEADFFFPLGGHERYVPAPERQADVRATKHISRLFDAVRFVNPTWSLDEDRHALNVFMVRVLFCLFAEDVGIFAPDVFTSSLVQSTRVDGTDLGAFLTGAFAHMKCDPSDRSKASRGWSRLPYVNGGLFEEETAMPSLDGRCRKHLLDCARLNWKTINPDIFGSMLQTVVDIEKRSEMGVHYTSPTNIAKVLNSILLDELRSDLNSAGANKAKLHALLNRLGKIRIFDPACGSGNFLILAYKDLRAIEMEVFRRLGELPHTVVKLEVFFGIEVDDFACQTARLGLWIAEYQVNEVFRREMGKAPPALPLTAAGRIVRGNSSTVDWLWVCPPSDGMETYVVGNPPFKGAKHQSKQQRIDVKSVFTNKIRNFGELDYVSIWFFKAAVYSEQTGARVGLVSTNSVVQGASVPALWPRLLEKLEINFAHRSFKWSNLATNNAGVTCVIVGFGPKSNSQKRLFDTDTVRSVNMIGPYLVPDVSTIVMKRSKPLRHDLDQMTFGNMPNNGEALLLDRNERSSLFEADERARDFVRPLFGSQELIQGQERWCIWVKPEQVRAAAAIDPLAKRFEKVKAKRLASSDAAARKMAQRPWAFREQNEASSHTILIPRVSSESRIWLPVDVKNKNAIAHDRLFAIYDGDIWQASVLSSRLHRLWLDTVGGKLEDRLSYSNQLVWNTFPMPDVSDRRKEDLEEHWWEIDCARKEAGFDKTLADLYAPRTMPIALRKAHEDLDDTVETIFGSRKYKSDADRVEHMLQLYDRAITTAPTK